MKLLSKSPKTIKSDESGNGYLTAIMYLAPHKVSGRNVCPNASPGCIAGCLNLSGRGFYNNVQQARINRTNTWFDNRESFKSQLVDEIKAFVRKCVKNGVKAAVRLNGTSDIAWEKVWPELFTMFPEVQFYDYTKSFKRMIAFCFHKLPPNYHLTFSRSEVNEEMCKEILRYNGNVAVVFSHKNIPAKYNGHTVHNADETDLRFLDKPGIQGLYAKGKAKRDTSGFVVKI